VSGRMKPDAVRTIMDHTEDTIATESVTTFTETGSSCGDSGYITDSSDEDNEAVIGELGEDLGSRLLITI
jgi:hypothetical protein